MPAVKKKAKIESQESQPPILRRVITYKLKLNAGQMAVMDSWLETCRRLYNEALGERIRAYEQEQITLRYIEQNRWLTERRAQNLYYDEVPRSIAADVLDRLDKAYAAFFRRVKEGTEAPGFPRFKRRGDLRSLGFPGFSVINQPVWDGKVAIPKIGRVRYFKDKPLLGKPKTATYVRGMSGWYVKIVCEIEKPEPLPPTQEQIGIDLGVKVFAALSNGEFIDNPRTLWHYHEKVVYWQKRASRRKKGSQRQKEAYRMLAIAREREARARRQFLHAVSRQLIHRFDLIAVEQIKPLNLMRRPKPIQDEGGSYLPNGARRKSGLSRSISDVSWGAFVEMLSYKAEYWGRQVVKIDPKYTSQECSGCGEIVRKTLKERTHSCPHCGLTLDRDTNAAVNVLARGQSATTK